MATRTPAERELRFIRFMRSPLTWWSAVGLYLLALFFFTTSPLQFLAFLAFTFMSIAIAAMVLMIFGIFDPRISLKGPAKKYLWPDKNAQHPNFRKFEQRLVAGLGSIIMLLFLYNFARYNLTLATGASLSLFVPYAFTILALRLAFSSAEARSGIRPEDEDLLALSGESKIDWWQIGVVASFLVLLVVISLFKYTPHWYCAVGTIAVGVGTAVLAAGLWVICRYIDWW